ncbi:hypothetical protein OKW24_005637 [Peribacillus simplex]|uniref:hypothetical protein n=1 Tax=Peribacillus simplex TaxID=1478 RepID=UPI0024E21033|nr:hypothetical protein [Peribacillus simplex]MDF9763726.1 hypothetical protein [Peribacillus simplex]MDF9763741.1 hypothetical protein [Peribacillus simplex]
MKNPHYFISFIIALVLALAVTKFSFFKGTSYMMYSLLEIIILVPLGIIVISFGHNLIGKLLSKN